MWLPTPVYERIPQFWFLIGLLFFANGLYLGLDIPIAFGYLTIGVICCAYGIGIAVVRTRYRRAQTSSDDSAEDKPVSSYDEAVSSDDEPVSSAMPGPV